MAAETVVAVTKKAPAPDLSGAYYLGTLTGTASYEAGGMALANPASPNIGLPSKIDFLLILGNGSGYRAEYVASTGKVKVFVAGKEGEVAKEVANATNLSAQSFPFFALGAS